MNKDAVKVLKRDEITEARKTPAALNTDELESDNQRKMGKTVNSWITERRKNRQTEKTFSDSLLLAWKIIP